MPVKNKIDRGLGPNSERIRQAGDAVEIVTLKEEKAKVYRMMDASILDLLLSRGQINQDQFRYGKTFYRDWFLSGLPGAGAIDYTKIRVDTSTSTNMSHKSLMALTRWNAAVRAIGKVHCHPLTAMVLLEQTPEQYGRDRCGQRNGKLARLAAITLLIAALDALCEHHGVEVSK